MEGTFQTGSRSCRRAILSTLRRFAAVILTLTFSIEAFCSNPTIALSAATGGITITANAGSLGNVNGLGVGTVGSGVGLITSGVSNGVFYYSPINVTVANLAGNSGSIAAYASTDFTHNTVLTGYTCTASCTSFSGYTQLSTNPPGATIIASTPTGSTVEVWVGAFVSNTNGGSAYTGGDSIKISFIATDKNGNKSAAAILTLSLNVQTAVQLTLSSATGGLTVSPASDFVMNFGNVNGLGINPAAGLTATSVSGGYVYNTPYLITPAFSGFTTTSTGTLKVNVGTNFLSPTMIYLEDSASSGGPYTAITATGLTITTAAGSAGAVQRYLGLFVSSANGSGVFTGSDSATLTYTLSVP
jgi:hypothetical protein